MEIIRDPAEYQRRCMEWRGGLHGLVPTMGALHAGHYRLIEQARATCERVSVSIFVNPLQFAPTEDLARYPRPFEADAEGCRARGVDILFVPEPGAIYPERFQTTVHVDRLTRPLCGRTRPTHFDGVTTVVLKLFMLSQAHKAFFGWKDAQQLLVIARMARDLDVPVEIVGVEIVRDADGLALSSRNVYLSAEQRAEAPRIRRGLAAAAAAFASGERRAVELVKIARGPLDACPLMRVDYLEARSIETLDEVVEAREGDTLLAAAVYMGTTRLIDNVRL